MSTTETQYWAKELCAHPERESECHCWQHFDGDEWLTILKEQPKFDKHCSWQFVEEWNCSHGHHNWVTLLSAQPQFAERCKDWSIFKDLELITMISNQPQLAIHVKDVDKRGGKVCALVLKVVPEIKKLCKFEQFSGADIRDFVLEMDVVDDDILARLKWDNIHGEDWTSILSVKPQYSQYAKPCHWRKLNADDWRRLLSVRSEFREQFEQYASEETRNDFARAVV